MAFKPFKAISKVFSSSPVGSLVTGGLIGLAGATILKGLGRESKSARNEANAQRAAYENQLSNIRKEQGLINENIARSQARTNAGIARANRSRIRGGGFRESTGSNNISASLG